jgi:hypothetical protein
MSDETSIKEFIDAIEKLPDHEHKDRWLHWLRDYNKEGPFGRKAGEEHSAKYSYNHIAYPEMLLWLIQAAGFDEDLVKLAETDCEQVTNMHKKVAAIRKRVTWKMLERELWGQQ